MNDVDRAYQQGYDQGRKEERSFIRTEIYRYAARLHDKADSVGHHWVMTIYRMLVQQMHESNCPVFDRVPCHIDRCDCHLIGCNCSRQSTEYKHGASDERQRIINLINNIPDRTRMVQLDWCLKKIVETIEKNL